MPDFYTTTSAAQYMGFASSTSLFYLVHKHGIEPDAKEVTRSGKRHPLYLASTLDRINGLREQADAERAARKCGE